CAESHRASPLGRADPVPALWRNLARSAGAEHPGADADHRRPRQGGLRPRWRPACADRGRPSRSGRSGPHVPVNCYRSRTGIGTNPTLHRLFSPQSGGRQCERLTNNDAEDSRPDWSADGTRIAFVSMRDGNYEIYVMNSDGTGQTRVTRSAGDAIQPDWRPVAITR
ncbi:MAG: hypothetical protein GTO22_02350, partial [Gemmatimonadales bacterium]|nr:hypothetical protein [Gemmatimonadales bacterium]